MSLPYKTLTLGLKVKPPKPHRWLSTLIPDSSAILSYLHPAPHINTPELSECLLPVSFAQVSPPARMPTLPSGHCSDATHLDPPFQTQLLTPTPRAKPYQHTQGPFLCLNTVALGCEGSSVVPATPNPTPSTSRHRVQQTTGFIVSDSKSSTKLSTHSQGAAFLSSEKATGCRAHLPSPCNIGERWARLGGCSPGWPASPDLVSNIFIVERTAWKETKCQG